MITYIAILRGINVSGKRIIKMDALKQLFAELGNENIRTYIQSGNIVFENKKSNAKQLEKLLSAELKKQFGFDVPVLVYDKNEFKSIIDNNPFVHNKLIDPAHLHITFLNEEPKSAAVNKISASEFSPDEFSVIGKAVYLFCPNGYGTTKLTTGFFESKLSTSATTRNWKTTNQLLVMAEKHN
jgi:uncharacterized protein (DUF1697 family)